MIGDDEAVDADEDCGKTHKAVQKGDHLRHLGHLDLHGQPERAEQAAGYHGDDDEDNGTELEMGSEYGSDERYRHAGDAIPVSALRGLLLGQSREGQNKENSSDYIGRCN